MRTHSRYRLAMSINCLSVFLLQWPVWTILLAGWLLPNISKRCVSPIYWLGLGSQAAGCGLKHAGTWPAMWLCFCKDWLRQRDELSANGWPPVRLRLAFKNGGTAGKQLYLLSSLKSMMDLSSWHFCWHMECDLTADIKIPDLYHNLEWLGSWN